MGTEIERKFLVTGESWRNQGVGRLYQQGYVVKGVGVTVRVRVVEDQGYLTLKGKPEQRVRPEFEYKIPVADAQEMLRLWCHPHIVEKTRYRIPLGAVVWEVDEFLGFNQGLILAEVELMTPDQSVDLPDWVGQEVSEQDRYYNSNLAQHPYSLWSAQEREGG